jgi:hypothetical protein
MNISQFSVFCENIKNLLNKNLKIKNIKKPNLIFTVGDI